MDNKIVSDPAVYIVIGQFIVMANPVALPYVLAGFGIFSICNVISSITNRD